MLAVSLVGCTPEDLPPDQGELRVLERPYLDRSRPTPALAYLPGAEDRPLPTRVWIGPASGEDAPGRPLLLMAHGYDGHPTKFEAFASDLANAGLVVAAPTFPATHFGSGAGPLGAGDLPEQPGDLSFVLDRLLEEVEAPASPLWRRFDPDAVVVLGHSLGGATVLGWTRFPGADERPRAVATLAPAVPLTVVFGPTVPPEGPPMLILHGLEDPVVPYFVSEDLYAWVEDPAWLLGLAGADHSEALESQEVPAIPERAACQAAVLAFVEEQVRGAVGATDQTLRALAADGHDARP